MAAEDFIIRIVLDAQSKIAPVMASAAAEADKLRDRFRDVDRAAGSLDKRLDQLEGHVSKARDTMRSMNPTLDALDRKLGAINRTTTGINRNFGVLERNSGKAAAALGGLAGVVGKLESKLNELDRKMTEMGARTYEPKLEVAGTEKAEAKVNALIGKLASASRGQWTAKTDVEIGAAIAKVEALRKELESLGAGDRARKLILDIEIEHWEDFDAKMAAAEAAKRKLEGGTHVRIDDSEVDALIFKLASETAKRHTFKTDVETAAAERGIERLRLKLHELGQGSRADNLILDIETRLDQAQIVTDAKAALAEAKAATREGFSFHAFLETGQFNKDYNDARAKLFELANIKVSPRVRLGVAEFEAERLIVEEQLLRLGLKKETIKVVLDYDRGNWRNVIGSLQEQFQQASENIKSSTEVTLRGIINGAINAAILFAEPLLSALTAVVGGLVAMGVAAGQAVAALAGLATAAVAQGVPALGILAVAFQRVSAVMKVSQLLQAERDKGAQQSIGIDKSRANALDAVRAAHEGVANAQRNLIDTQKRLTEARQQGIRTLNDMILAEQRSQLTAQQSRLTTAIAAATGDTSGLFQEKQLSAQADQRTANRAQVDTQKAVAGGVEGLPQVQAAAKAVADAQRALANAERQVASAVRGLDAAGAKIGAAASAYEIALGKLSGGERKLLGSIERIKGAFRDTNGEIRSVSDIITVSLANALDRVAKMFSDPAILRAFTGLAKSIGASIDTLAKFFTSGPLKGALIFFTNEASRNFGPLTKIITGLIDVLIDVAKAASGPLHDALNGIAGFFERIHKSAGSPEGQKNMREFFEGGLGAMKSFLGLGGAIINLFLALAGPGGATEEGINGIDRLSGAINRAADYIENNQTKVHAFFRDAINGSADVMKVIIALGKFLVKTFDPKSLSEFSKFIRQVVLPVLAGFVIGLGAIVRGLLAISNSTAGTDLLKLAGVFIGLRFVLLRVRALFYDIGLLVLKLPALFGGLSSGLVGFYRLVTLSQDSMILLRLSILKTAIAQGIQTAATKAAAAGTAIMTGAQWLLNAAMTANPIGIVIFALVALGAAFIVAYKKIGFFRDGVNAVFSWIKDHWKLVLVLITGPIGLAVAAIVEFGPKVLGLFKDAFGGVMDWVKDHWKAIIGIVGGPLGAIITVIEKFGGKIFGPFKKAFETIKGYARTVWNDIKKIFGGGGTNDGPQQGGLPTSPGSPSTTADPLGLGPTGFKPPSFKQSTGGFHDSISTAGTPKSKPKTKKKDDPLSFEDTLSASESKITPQEAEKIKTLWAGILRSTQEKTAGISKAVRDMRVAIEATLKRLTRVGSDDFDDLWKNSRHSMGNLATSVDVQLKNVVRSFKDSMKSVTETVYDAFSYIDTQVGKSLKALGGDPIKLTIDKPPTERRAEGGFAGAGWVGMKGERGGDTVRALIGRGEAVLNYAHQRVVEPAMQYFYGYGLSDMFKRNRAEHAGLNSGYASGGFVNSPGAHIDTPAEKSIAGRLGRLGKKLGITFSPAGPRSARRTPAENVAVGGAQGSNHLLGRAMDVAPDAIKTIANSILNSFGLNRPMPGNWIGTDGKVHDERNHIELLGTAISSAVNAFVDTTIKKIKVNGPDGALKSIASRAITKVRTAANTQLSGAETVGLTGPTASTAGGGGVVPGILAIARHAAFLNKVKWDERLTRILLQKESGGGKNLPPHNYGGILDPAGPFQIISSTFAANAFKGHGNRMNPEDNALAAFHYIKARYGSLANLARITGLLGDNYQGYKHGGFVGAIQQFAKGGVVQGAVGKAVPVIAHGGELILNKIQQSRLGRMMAIGGFVGADETPQERYLRILREEDQRRRQANENAPVDPKTLAIGLAFPIAGVAGNMIAGAVLARLASKNRLLEDPIEKPGLNPKYLNVGRAVQYEAFGTTNVGQVTGFHAGSGDPYIRKAGTSQERIISRSQVTIGKDSADAKRIVGLFQFLDEEHKKYSVTKRLADRDAKEAANEKARRKARKGPELFRGTPNTDPGKFELYDQGTGRRGPGTHASTDRNLAELYARPQGQFAYKSNTPGGGFIYSARLNPQAKGISWERADELPKEVVGEKGWERREHPTEAAKRHGYDFMEKGLYENGGKDSDIILLTEKAIAEPLSRARRAAQAASAAFKKTVAPIIEPISDYLTTRSLTKMYPETLRQLGNSFAASDIDRIVHDYPGSDEIKIYLKGDTGLPQHAYAAEGEGPGRATPKFEGAINDSTALKLAALRGEVENVKIPITERLGYNAQYYKNRTQEGLKSLLKKLADESGQFDVGGFGGFPGAKNESLAEKYKFTLENFGVDPKDVERVEHSPVGSRRVLVHVRGRKDPIRGYAMEGEGIIDKRGIPGRRTAQEIEDDFIRRMDGQADYIKSRADAGLGTYDDADKSKFKLRSAEDIFDFHTKAVAEQKKKYPLGKGFADASDRLDAASKKLDDFAELWFSGRDEPAKKANVAQRGEVENVKIPITERLGYNAQYYKNRLQERLRPIADKLKDEAGSFGFFNKQPENGVDAVIRKSEASQDSTREWKDGWKGTVYHGTSEEKHASILANGFDVNAAARARRGEGRGTVFFAHTPDGANYGPKRVEAKVHLKKPMVFWYDPEAPADTAYARERGRTGAMLSDPPEAAKLGWGSDELSQLAKKTGHDGAIYPRRDEMQVFDPAAIKRIKNYDPEANFKSNVVDKLGRFAGVAGKLTNRLFAAAAIKDVVTGHLLSGLTQAAGFIPGPGGLFASALLAAALHNNKNLPTRGPERAALDKRNYDAGRTGPAIGGGRLVHSSVPQHAPEPPPLSHFAQEEIKKRSRIKKAPYKGFKQRVFAAGGFNDEPAWDWGGWQKDGGTYLVNRPTLFGAGEAGPEIAHFASGKSGTKFKGPNPVKVFESGLGDLATDFAPVDGLTDLLKKVFKSVGKLADGGKKSLSRLANAFDVFGTDATNPFKLLEAAIVDRAKLAARRLKQQIFRVSPTGRGERRQISAQTSGAIELGILNQSRDSYEEEAKVNAGALKDAQQALKGAKTKKQKQAFQAQVNRLVNQRGAIQDALADNAQAIVERQEQMQREILDASNKYFDGLRAGIDRARRIADALGTGGETGRIDQTVKIAKDQIKDLSGQLKDAKKNGNQELATQIQAQIDELNTSVIELGAQRLQAVVDDINKNAEKNLGTNDLKQKFASFGITQQQAQSGNFNIAALGRTDFAAQGQALNERGDILRQQRTDLAAQLAQAGRDGNVKVTEALTKQMNDLDVSIIENTVAIRDNTQAAFQAAVDNSHTMSDFLLAANQGQTGILTALGLDPSGSLQQRGGILQGAISSDKGFLAKLFNDTPGGVGIDPTVLAGIGPEGLAPFLTGKYQEAVASGKYSDPQLEAMRGLITGLLGNTQALIENTQALSPDNTQNFSSTAWTVFRRAIFDGSGGLLPQFQLPHMDVGGLITKSGPIYAHAGEVITPYHERMSGSRGDTNVNVNIKESDQVNDPVALANRIAYTIKTER